MKLTTVKEIYKEREKYLDKEVTVCLLYTSDAADD